MTKRNLLEAATLVSESASDDGTWKVRLISEGRGSSGVYPASLLEGHHHAFDNVLSFKNHPTGWDGPQERDFTMIAGKVVGETWVERDERGLTAVYGNYLPDPEYKDKIARYKDQLGLSIYIEGSGYVEESSGDFVVDWFNPEDPYASVDVVIAPGARGKFMENMRKTYDSLHSESNKPGVTSAPVEERKLEMDQEIKDAFAALTDLISPLVAKEQTAQAEAAQAEADAKAVEEALAAYDAAVTAIDAAELPAKVVESLRKQAKDGVDVAPLIEQATEMKAALAEAAGDVTEGRVLSGDNKGFSLTKIAEAR